MMRKTLLSVGFLLLISAGLMHAQDTTALRVAGFSDGGELILFKNDSTNLYYGPVNANASFNALFHHPNTGDLYCLYDSVLGSGRRDFYTIDPFAGTMSFVYSPPVTYLAAACVGPNGVIYAMRGNAGGTPGAIYQIDLFTGTTNLFMTTDFTFGGTAQTGANITYYPPTNELWIFGGGADSLIKIEVNTQVETRVAAFLNTDDGIKATYLDGTTFWLCSDASYTLDALTTPTVQPSTVTIPDFVTDMEKLDLIEGGDTIGICGGDSATLRSRFRFDDYHWYFNGNPLTAQNRSFNTATPGTYQLLAQYDNNGGFYMWSEVVEVVVAPAPTAGFGQSTFNTVVGSAVSFTDSSLFANSYAWNFGDGGSSPLANPTHTYNTPGVYTVMQIVQRGPCTDTAFSTVTVTLVGLADAIAGSGIRLSGCFPNPAATHAVAIVELDHAQEMQLELLDLSGAPIAMIPVPELSAGSHKIPFDLQLANGTPIASGMYLLRLSSASSNRSIKLLVQH